MISLAPTAVSYTPYLADCQQQDLGGPTTSIRAQNYERLLAHLQNRHGMRLGETTADGAFTLLPAACLGACDLAPALLVDGELHGNLDEIRLDRLLEDVRRKDRA